MRAPVVGLFRCSSLETVAADTRATAVITHAHPLGQDGAVLVALTVALALQNRPREEIWEELDASSREQPPSYDNVYPLLEGGLGVNHHLLKRFARVSATECPRRNRVSWPSTSRSDFKTNRS